MATKFFPRRFRLVSFSLLISIALVFSYILLANDQLFIPLELQQKLAFNLFFQPANALFFLFVHTGVAHLVANLLLVFFLGRVVEQSIPRYHVLVLFLGVGAVSFALFNFVEPLVFGIGASGGAIALTASALLLSPQKSFFALLSVLVVSLILMLGVSQYQFLLDEGLKEQKQKTETELQQAIQTKNQLVIQTKTRELKTVTKTIEDKKQHRQYEKELEVANTVHIIASILAVAYLFLFCSRPAKKAMRQNTLHLKKILSQTRLR